MFQAASNFNAVESISESIPPDRPFFTQDYVNDFTQGPAASISAGAAAITRVHAAFYDSVTEPKLWRQTKERQINLLDGVSEYIPVVNGYAILRKGLPSLPSQNSTQYERLLRSTRIAYHRYVQVTSGERVSGDNFIAKNHSTNQRIDQVFVAALNVGQGFSGVKNDQLDRDKSRQEFVLRSAYYGTYLSAILNRRKHLVLTMIGGGAFSNSRNLIFKSIVQAHLRYGQHPASTLHCVSIILYSPYERFDNAKAILTKANIPWQFVRYDPETGNKEMLSESSYTCDAQQR